MAEIEFEAIGTHWSILTDDEPLNAQALAALQAEIKRFDQTYSRFIEDSLVCRLARESDGEYPLSAEFAEMVRFGLELKELTTGAFDLNTAAVQEAYGYDQTYSFKNSQVTAVQVKPGKYTLKGSILYKEGLVKFDLGAFGKGYLIDLIAQILLKLEYRHFLIDGGRDFFGTTKKSGQPWRIALEHPWISDEAVGVVFLANQGLACSNSYHRKVGEFHHLLNAQTARPAPDMASVYVLAENATIADGLSTALFVAQSALWPEIIKSHPCQYVLINNHLQVTKSEVLNGEIFS